MPHNLRSGDWSKPPSQDQRSGDPFLFLPNCGDAVSSLRSVVVVLSFCDRPDVILNVETFLKKEILQFYVPVGPRRIYLFCDDESSRIQMDIRVEWGGLPSLARSGSFVSWTGMGRKTYGRLFDMINYQQ